MTDLQTRWHNNTSHACLAVLEFQNLTSESLVSVQSILEYDGTHTFNSRSFFLGSFSFW